MKNEPYDRLCENRENDKGEKDDENSSDQETCPGFATVHLNAVDTAFVNGRLGPFLRQVICIVVSPCRRIRGRKAAREENFK
jgi:hypothetical protein